MSPNNALNTRGCTLSKCCILARLLKLLSLWMQLLRMGVARFFFPLSPSCRSPESGWLVVKA